MWLKWDSNGTRMGLEWDSNGTRMGFEWDLNGTRMGLEWDSNGTRMGLEWDSIKTRLRLDRDLIKTWLRLERDFNKSLVRQNSWKWVSKRHFHEIFGNLEKINLVTYQMVYEDEDIQRLYCPLTTEIRTDPKIQWVSCWHCSKINISWINQLFVYINSWCWDFTWDRICSRSYPWSQRYNWWKA